MKKMKKLASLVLALAMALTLAVPAMAADDEKFTITINNVTAGHTYEAYQIFAGDLARASENDNADGTSAVLSNIVWGKNISAEGQSTLGNAATVAKDITNADEFAKQIATYLTGTPATSTYADGVYTISGLEAGYYLIKDKNGSVTGHDSYTKYIIEVVENSTVDPKDGTTTSEKKVDDKNDSNTSEDTANWQDSADYDIGDSVPFQLKATIAEDYGTYNVYKLTFHDTEEKGLTFQEDTVKVYVDNVEITGGFNVNVNPKDGHTFDVVFADLKQISSVKAGSVITVEYKSTLNVEAEIGSAGNKNTMYVTYSNNPNDEQGGENGKTPDDTVIVFTYKVIVKKVDEDLNPLAGAEFTLEKFVASESGTETYKEVKGNWVAKDVVETNPDTTFTFNGLDDGEYRLTETETPPGYNSIKPVYFTVTADHDDVWDGVNRTDVLDSLTGDVTTGEITFASSVTDGSLTTDVENQSGATLPETGGMGTTLFYALGAVLVIGAGVAMVTKKRMA